MKFLMIDDEHILYKVMMADLFRQEEYDVEEISRMQLPKLFQRVYDLHHTYRFDIPFKGIWNRYYALHKYPFRPEETYVVLFMNGSLRKHFDKRYLLNIKRKHPNVKLALLLFDQSSYFSARRSIALRDVFDYAFSFDDDDCQKYNMEKFYTCFSYPDHVYSDESVKSTAYFAGSGVGRLDILKKVFSKLTANVSDCRFYITEVPEKEIYPIEGVTYNHPISFLSEIQLAYNTNCVIEVLKAGQKGISLRVCEAVLFNKKLLTNNSEIKKLPFYNPQFISVFSNEEDLDIDFILQDIDVSYDYHGEFSPIRILEKIVEKETKNNK